VLGSEIYPGRYNPERFPFFRVILEALGPEEVARVIVLMGSAQIGKTLIAQIFIAASLDLDPGQILYTHPTEGNAVRYARTKWRPMIQSTTRSSGSVRDPAVEGRRQRDAPSGAKGPARLARPVFKF
jgi:phage terminase large subunit GpA-like protein